MISFNIISRLKATSKFQILVVLSNGYFKKQRLSCPIIYLIGKFSENVLIKIVL